jgi:hypothetical protein
LPVTLQAADLRLTPGFDTLVRMDADGPLMAGLQRPATRNAIATEAIIPLHFQASHLGVRAGTAIEPRTDERAVAASFRPVQ